jgi:hypothetical protein
VALQRPKMLIWKFLDWIMSKIESKEKDWTDEHKFSEFPYKTFNSPKEYIEFIKEQFKK